MKQVHQDFEKTQGFGSRQVRWVFDGKIGNLASVKAWAQEALEGARDAGDPRFPPAKVNSIIDYLNEMIKVGTN